MCPPQPAQSFFEQKKYWGIPFKVEPEASSYPLGRLNCDPPVALLRSVMEHMAHVAAEMTKKGPGRPDFVLFTGGLVGWMLPPPFWLPSPSRIWITTKGWSPNKGLLDSFEVVVHPICSFFLLVKICLFVPLSEVIFQVISFHVNIIKRESLNWLLAEGSFLFFSVALRDVGWCREIGRCLVLSTMFVVSWYFVSSGQSIWLAGKSTSFWENIGFLRFMFWSSKIK